MEMSLNDKGDLEKGLLSTSGNMTDKQCEEWVYKHGTTIVAIAVILAGAGFLAYICVVVLEMRSDVSDLKKHADNIDNINASIGNLQYKIGSIEAVINGLDLQVQNICRHISC